MNGHLKLKDELKGETKTCSRLSLLNTNYYMKFTVTVSILGDSCVSQLFSHKVKRQFFIYCFPNCFCFTLCSAKSWSLVITSFCGCGHRPEVKLEIKSRSQVSGRTSISDWSFAFRLYQDVISSISSFVKLAPLGTIISGE